MRSMFTYNLIELHLIPKMLGSQHNNAEQLSSQSTVGKKMAAVRFTTMPCEPNTA